MPCQKTLVRYQLMPLPLRRFTNRSGVFTRFSMARQKRDRDVRLGTERLIGHAADLGAGADAIERLIASIPSPTMVARVRALVTEHEGLRIGLAAARQGKGRRGIRTPAG